MTTELFLQLHAWSTYLGLVEMGSWLHAKRVGLKLIKFRGRTSRFSEV
jgi:hypothetical protein